MAAATGPAATGASVAYLVFYAAMNLGAFAVVMHVTRHPAPTALPAEPAGALAQDSRPSTQGPGALGQEPGVLAQASSAPGQARGPSQSGAEAGAQEPGDLDAYRGLARRNPAAALALAFCLICLAGLPPGLAGLFAKIVVFREIVDGGGVVLAIVMAVNTVIGLYYYVAWTARLFTPPAPAAIPTASTPAALRAQPVVPAAVPMSIAPVPSTGDAVQVPSTGDAGPTPGTGNAAQVRPGSGDAGPVSGTGNAGPVPGTRDIAPAPLATEAPRRPAHRKPRQCPPPRVPLPPPGSGRLRLASRS
ncbi:proton-conducting transporter transmembrane domain-containing protein [Thermocatellispora tengchongensis]|uniref:proton-conducting transporter transmembrane domain-containing protein n=1 Tax=Thermocatellispora tengchongensis TaxID=1073253 RepID=UPI00362E4A3A